MKTTAANFNQANKVINNANQTTTMQGERDMSSNRRLAIYIGIMFILASASAIAGLLYYGPILNGADYLINGAAQAAQIRLGALMELILVVSAIGTAIGMFPFLRPYGERISLVHLCFRFLEAVVITVGIIAVLSLLTLSEQFVASNNPDAASYHVVGSLLHAIYRWTSALGPLMFLGINTLMYSSLLYKSKLVPRPLALWGITGAILVLCAALVVISGVATQLSALAITLIMPIAVFEMVLASWLIIKGFNPAVLAEQPKTVEARTLLHAV